MIRPARQRDHRGVSSAGRAPALQAGGHRFDPDTLHQLNGSRRAQGSMKGLTSYTFSIHAVEKLHERGEIKLEWVDETLRNPVRVEECSAEEKHFLRPIEAFNNRWLRVVVNPSVSPPNIITIHFDRSLKRKRS